MVLPTVLLRIAVRWLLSCYTAAKKLRNYGFLLYKSPAAVARSQQSPAAAYPGVDKCPLQGRAGQTVVFDVENTLLRSPSLFPFFMLVAFEGGSVLRAFLLLLCYPLVWAFTRCGAARGSQMGLCLMAFVTFCGLRKRDAETAARAVLPKFFLEDLHLHAYEAVMSAGRKVAVTTLPRVMVEWFLREYLGVDDIVSADLDLFAGGGRFTGLFSTNNAVKKSRVVKELVGGDAKPDLGLAGGSDPDDHLFLSLCKEAYVVTKEVSTKVGTSSAAARVVPRKRYPKPLVFHDGRLAFLPSPSATLALFLWLPFSVLLSIIRIVTAMAAPSGLAIFLGACIGNHLRVNGLHLTDNRYVPQRGGGEESHGTQASDEGGRSRRQRGVLYVCNHRTLLDPVVLSISLGKPLTAVTYSLSKVSEILSPISTVRLCRDRERDGATMHRLLGEGDLAVCPEGTTCREPYLLRFSPLFAELTDEIAPVGMESEVTMFYGTTAGGYKWMDPFFFLMNPRTMYRLHFLGRVPREATCASGRSSRDVANDMQRRLADKMGFECTTLTRRDKYLVLAGNDGVVVPPVPSPSVVPVVVPPASAHVSADGGGGGGSSSTSEGGGWQRH
ncbi:hypothetical protein Taro_053548 [Colocasia esculenta]|uniref:Phospholipid/glycerol acyltransferase domain-containing protein n=1 Tax=Colocasia esculenta TaxID=4460 RepID=A0A843XMI0_COLES|nr:hypothetical protein [Colocasia esculenta]